MILISTKARFPEGFTLLEVLISMGLIAIALMAVFRLQGQNLDLQSEAHFVTLSRYLAQERLSRIQAEDSISMTGEAGEFSEDFPHTRYQEEVAEVPEVNGLFKARIRIFSDVPGSSESFTTVTYLFHRPK